jgi:hypothetical protein
MQRDINLTQSFISNNLEDFSAYWLKKNVLHSDLLD